LFNIIRNAEVPGVQVVEKLNFRHYFTLLFGVGFQIKFLASTFYGCNDFSVFLPGGFAILMMITTLMYQHW